MKHNRKNEEFENNLNNQNIQNNSNVPNSNIDNSQSHLIKKKIFAIIFPSGSEQILYNKLLKICDLFGASRYNVPRREDIDEEIKKINLEILQNKNYMREAQYSIRNFLRDKMGNVRKINLCKYYFIILIIIFNM